MPCADNTRVILVLKRRTSKVDQPNIRIPQDRLGLRSRLSRADKSRLVADEEDVFRLEIGVDEFQAMQDWD